MRKGIALLVPFVFVAGLHVACSSDADRRSFTPAPSASATGFATTPPPQNDGGLQGCSQSKTEISRVPVTIQLVVDESGSMIGDKWEAQTQALAAVFQDLKDTADPATFVGVTMFDTSVNDVVKPDTLLKAGHFDDLKSAAVKSEPNGGGTGTLKALQAAFSTVESFAPSDTKGLVIDEMKRVVVLVSDGEPSGGADEQTQCLNLVGSKSGSTTKPISTFSIGIGPFPTATGYDPTFMGKIAQKGATAPAGCNPAAKVAAGVCHFQVTPGQNATATKQALVDALQKIRALAASCEFEFTVNDLTDLSNVKVEITDKDGNKTPIDKDGENGWSFDDDLNPTKIVLTGSACSASSGTVSGRVDVIVGCKGAN